MKDKKLLRRILALLMGFVMVIGSLTLVPAKKAEAASTITVIDIEDLVLPQIGKKPESPGITLAAGSHFTVSSVDWRYANGTYEGGASVGSSTFIQGTQFFAKITLKAAEGWEFPTGDPSNFTKLEINGREDFIYGIHRVDAGTFEIRTSEMTPWKYRTINKVYINDLDLPVASDKPDYSVTLPSGAGYHLASASEISTYGFDAGAVNGIYWYKDDSQNLMSSDSTFLSGSKYYAAFALVPNSGYEFTAFTKVYISKGKFTTDRQKFQTTYAYFADTKYVEPLEAITEAAVINLDMPVYGQSPDYQVNIPSGAHYHLADGQELNQYGYDYSFASGGVHWNAENYVNAAGNGYLDPGADVFETGVGKFYASFVLVADEGYAFTSNASAKLNYSTSLVDRTQSHQSYYFFDTQWITAKTPISKVEINDLDLPVENANPDFEVSVPSDANYYLMDDGDLYRWDIQHYDKAVNGMWWYDIGTRKYMTESDIFWADRDNADYQPRFCLLPKDGYAFTNDTVVSINGYESYVYGSYVAYDDVLCVDGISFYATPLQTISKIYEVHVSGIDTPVLGNTPDFTAAIPAGANYHIASEEELRSRGYISAAINGVYWWIEAGWVNLKSSDTFTSAKPTYGNSVILISDEGYEFAEDAIGTYNGEQAHYFLNNGDNIQIGCRYMYAEFTDVRNKKSPFYNAIYWAAKKDITAGKNATQFGVNDGCTRGQVVTFLWRAAGKPEPTTTVNPFTDVSTSSPFYKAILWASQTGITNGITVNTFEPGTTCTRGQIVTFLWRYAKTPNPTTTVNPFTDVKTTSPFYKAILWAAENGITAGTTPTTFAPGDTCTRGQIVTFLFRYMGDTPSEVGDEIMADGNKAAS